MCIYIENCQNSNDSYYIRLSENQVGVEQNVVYTFGNVPALLNKCFTVIGFEECPQPDYEDVTIIESFGLNNCEDCLCPTEPEVISTGRVVYPTWNLDRLDPNKVEEIFCTFAHDIYQEVLQKKYGIKSCCEFDRMLAQIDYEIIKLDLIED